MDKPVVKELIQDELTPANLRDELSKLLIDPIRLEELKKDYSDLKSLLKRGGHASFNAAKIIVDFLRANVS